jgi:TonB family protein
MKQRFVSLMVLMAGGWFSIAGPASAQAVPSSEQPQAGLILTKLSPPVYPPLALQARIQGDVEVTVRTRQDGSVESAVIASGHPILAPAALESAKKSQFECHECIEAVTSYVLKYKFQIISRGYPKDCDYTEKQQPPAEIDIALHQITVAGWAIGICDPVNTIFKVRSAKCLYLWKCSTRYGL